VRLSKLPALAVIASAAAGIVPTLRGQQPKPTFQASIDLVQLDVSVLDKDRRPVRGLTASDFVVREDGNPQKIEVFSEVELPDAEPAGAAWMNRAPSDVETNAGESERLVAIVLDDAMIPQDPLFVRQTKLIATEVINRLGPRDAAAVIFSRDNRTAKSFTTDHAKLLAAVDKFNGGMAFTGPDDFSLYSASEITVSDVADSLIALPDRRKVLVLVSVGVGVFPELLAPTTRMGAALKVREEQVQLHDLLQGALDRARRANISIYSFDPGGLGGLEGFCMEGHNCTPPPGLSQHDYFRDFHDYMMTLPANTGGRPTLFTNDPIPGINEMFRENKSYYLLGYRQATPPKAGEYRRMDVMVNRKGMEVHARNLDHRELTAEERAVKMREPPPAANAKAIANVMPDASIPIRLNLIPFARTDGPGATVVVALGVREPAPTGTITEAVDLLMRAFTFDGAPRGERSAMANVTVAAPSASSIGADQPVAYEVVSRLDISKPGAYTVRVGVENKTRQLTGSVFADLDVPDFTSTLALSGVAVGLSSATPAAQIDSLHSLLPITPTTERAFSSADHAAAMFRIYEGGDGQLFPVTVHEVIRDAKDAVVYDRNELIPTERLGMARSTDVRLDLPLPTLGPGPHLLSFEAMGHDRIVRREVVFRIR